jgi:serine/threonine kinase 32
MYINRWIAVKEIRKFELLKHNSGHKMLMNELEALKRLESQHPFIIPLYVAFQDRTACYMVFDLKLGGDLRYFLRHYVFFEERDVAFMVACMSSALKHIHAKGIIHRDIKPENIIVDQLGFPYLADFGIAYVHPQTTSRRDSNTPCGLVSQLASGTKQYLAPEVFTRYHVHG